MATDKDFRVKNGLVVAENISADGNISITGTATIGDSTIRDDGSNLQITGTNQIQFFANSQFGQLIFYNEDGQTGGANVEQFRITHQGTLQLANNRTNKTIQMEATDHDVAGRDLTISAGDTTAGTTDNIAGGDLILQGGQGKGTGAGGSITFQVADGGSTGSTLNSLSTAMTIADDGNVGIGTTSPDAKLDIEQTDGAVHGLKVYRNDDSTSTPLVYLHDDHAFNDSPVLHVKTDRTDQYGYAAVFEGIVGIGTTSPSTELHVSGASHPSIRVTGTDNANADPAFELLGTADNFTEGGQMWYDNGTGVLHLASLYNNAAADIQFHTRTGADRSTSNVRMTIEGDGNVSIANDLTVSGNLTVSGTTTTLNTQTVEVEDNILQLNTTQGSPDTATANVSGFEIYRGDGVNLASLKFDDGNSDRWRLYNGTASMDFYMTTAVSEMSAESNHLYLTTKRDQDDIHLRTGTTETTRLFVEGDTGRVGIGTTSPGHKLEVNGSFAATTKSFDIEHPTKEGMRLHHGSLEGPEHGVYVRGRLEGVFSVIDLPDYWTGLVDEDSITVQLTPNGGFQQLYVEGITENKVYVKSQSDEPIDCFYFIQAERKDVDKMEVEY